MAGFKYKPGNKVQIFFFIVKFCILLNSSINFAIYCFASKLFRVSLQDLFRRIFGGRIFGMSVKLDGVGPVDNTPSTV